MQNQIHSLTELFTQLGLGATQEEIDAFILAHQIVDHSLPLADASFWDEAQSTFLREALAEDSDWSEVVDELNARLHTS
ncbi:MAG TPA: DUF2789 family protein [Marinobacterium sp.]|nr:DUF2789 family protein [Marinobacterium sp.]